MGLRMPKTAKVLCLHCDKKMDAGEAFCAHCQHPTQWATHDERVKWELQNYRKLQTASMEAPKAKPQALKRASTPRPSGSPESDRVHETTIVARERASSSARTSQREATQPLRAVVRDSAALVPRPAASPARKPKAPKIEDVTSEEHTPAATRRVRLEEAAPAPKVAKPAPVRKAKPSAVSDIVASSQPSVQVQPTAPAKRAPARRRSAETQTPSPSAPSNETMPARDSDASPADDIIDLTATADASGVTPARPPAIALLEEEVALLRELVTRVTAIEHHMAAQSAPQPRPAAQRRLIRRKR